MKEFKYGCLLWLFAVGYLLLSIPYIFHKTHKIKLYKIMHITIIGLVFVMIFVFGNYFANDIVNLKKAQTKTSYSVIQETEYEDKTVTVYVTNTGSKYHRYNCYTLEYSKIEISLEKAKKKYEPCKICNPPE